MLHKRGQYKLLESGVFDAKKFTPIDISIFPEEEMRSFEFDFKCHEIIRSVLSKDNILKEPMGCFTSRGDEFQLIQGSSSGDGSFALGFGMSNGRKLNTLECQTDNAIGELHYVNHSYEEWGQICNYVVNIPAKETFGITGCKYIGAKSSYNHRTVGACWSPNNRFLIQFHNGKWQTIEAVAVFVDERLRMIKVAELVNPIARYTYKFLAGRRDRALRRFGAERFAISLHCEELRDSGVAKLQVFGEIPKLGGEDSSFSLIEHLRFTPTRNGLSIKFLDVQSGPRPY